MTEFETLTLRNFQSYGNNITTFELNKPGTTLIVGEDLDNTSEGQGSNGVGKAQPMYSLIRTPTGWKYMSDMKVGDVVQTPAGGSAKVTGVFPQGVRPIYTVRFGDGRSTEADAEHLWSVQISGWNNGPTLENKIVRTIDLVNLLDPESPSYTIHNAVTIPLITPFPDPELTLTEQQMDDDVDHVTEAVNSIISESPIEMDDFLGDRVVWPEYKVRMLLDELVDCTGDSDRSVIQLNQLSKAELVQSMIWSLGGKATIVRHSCSFVPEWVAKVHNQDEYVVHYDTNVDGDGRLAVIDCVPAGETECQCIMIDDPEHLYITDDYIVTHNTTMLQGLIYALYDRAIGSDVTKDGLVNDINTKEMEVTLTFKADNGNSYKVIRQRKMKPGAEGNKTILYENGKDISVDVDGTNRKIIEVLGMPYELFVRIIVFSASNDSFLRLPATSTSGPNQRAFIEDLFGLSVITQKAELLKAAIKDTKMLLEMKRTQIDMQKAEQDRHKSQVVNAATRLETWEKSKISQIDALNAKLALVDGVDIDAQKREHARLKKVADEVANTKSEKAATDRECRQHLTVLGKLDEEISVLRDNKCPRCKQSFAGAADEIVSKEAELDVLNSEVDELVEKGKEQAEMLLELMELHNQIYESITVDNVEELIKIQSDAENIRQRVEEMKNGSNPHAAALTELESVMLSELDYSEINAAQTELDHQQFLLKLLTKSDSFVRKNLLNKYVPFLNSRVQFYLTMLGLQHVVEFQEDLTAKISRNGINTTFGLLSTGQKARVNFAFSVAFKDVRERLHGRANICMFDEVLDVGLDAVGVIACAKVIKHLARSEGISMYVISHRNEIDSMFDHKMTIQKRDGFSHIKQQEIVQ